MRRSRGKGVVISEHVSPQEDAYCGEAQEPQGRVLLPEACGKQQAAAQQTAKNPDDDSRKRERNGSNASSLKEADELNRE